MPAVSKSQQAAAGIAHAVEKGDLPQSKLRGASKQMFQGMHGTGELKKFAKTKTGGLPQHVKEGGPLTARQMFERDDLSDPSKVNVPRETKDYARMTSKDVMEQPGGTARKWTMSLNLRKAITNQRGIKGFVNQDKAETTDGKKFESAAAVVDALLED